MHDEFFLSSLGGVIIPLFQMFHYPHDPHENSNRAQQHQSDQQYRCRLKPFVKKVAQKRRRRYNTSDLRT